MMEGAGADSVVLFNKLFQAVIPMEDIGAAFKMLTHGGLPENLMVSFAVVNMLMTFLYFYLLENRLNQTPGKIFMSLVIEPIDRKTKQNPIQ